jgi:hypothetical protein
MAPEPAPGTQKDPRRPAGVALDPRLALPPGRPTSTASDGLAVLLAPVDPTPALRVVDAYFAALASESTEELERWLDRGAEHRVAPRARAEPALAALRRRFERLDYTVIAAELPYRPSEREVTTARGAVAAGEPPPPLVPTGDDVVVRVPIVSRVGSLFGSEVLLLLRRRGASYKIGEILEDFRLP